MKRIVDIHNHYIYDVDDGSKSLKMSMEMLRQAADRGITDIVATPHQYETDQADPEHKRQEKIIKHFEIIRDEVKKEKLPITLYLGSELFFTPYIRNAPNVPYFTYEDKKKYALIEFSLNWKPSNHDVLFYSLMEQDCTPVLAHPERYAFFWEFADEIMRLVRMGTLLQINGGSLLGNYGIQAQYISYLLLRNGLVHAISSDAHNPVWCDGFNLPLAVEICKKKYPDLNIDELISDNPWKILQGETLYIDNEPTYQFDTEKEYKLWRRYYLKHKFFGIENKPKRHK